MYQLNHRVVANGTPLDARFDNIAHAARRAGYAPTLFGYTDQAVDPRETDGPDDPRLSTYEEILPGFDVGLKYETAGVRRLDAMAARARLRRRRRLARGRRFRARAAGRCLAVGVRDGPLHRVATWPARALVRPYQSAAAASALCRRRGLRASP